MKSVNLSNILDGKECLSCKEMKAFSEFYKSNSKRKRRQVNQLHIFRNDYTPEAYERRFNTLITDDYCLSCRKSQVKQSKDSKQTANLAEIINNFWDFHYNKYPEIANYFPGFGNFDNNPIKNISGSKKPYMLNIYTYMFFFQFHNNSHRKRYITTFFDKYISSSTDPNEIEVSPNFLQSIFFGYKNQIPLFTMYKFCSKCKKFKQTYKEIDQVRMLLTTSRKQIHMHITPLNFQLAALSSKNGWQRNCMDCLGTFRRNTPDTVIKHLTPPQATHTLDPRRDRDTLYAQMPEELFNPSPSQGEEK